MSSTIAFARRPDFNTRISPREEEFKEYASVFERTPAVVTKLTIDFSGNELGLQHIKDFC